MNPLSPSAASNDPLATGQASTSRYLPYHVHVPDPEDLVARVGMPSKFVFVCLNERPEDHPRPSCIRNGSGAVFEALREETGRQGLVDVKVVASGCLEPCMVGPSVYVAPDDVWYGGVTVADVPQLVAQHLAGDEPVEFLRIGRPEFELSPLEGRSELPPGEIPPI